MAAVSAPQAQSALTPPSSSHGETLWNYSVPTQPESESKINEYRPPLSSTNGHALSHQNSRPDLSARKNSAFESAKSVEPTMLAPARLNALNRKDSSISEAGSAPDSLLDLYGTNRSGMNSVDYGDRKNVENYTDEDPDHSRWIHRDKLARIESQELQAAGIILPRSRAPSKSSRREQSREQGTGVRSEQAQKRQRIEPFPTEEEEAPESNAWDLRLPEEAAEEGYKDASGGVKGLSRIPVLKTSPLPIPIEHLERDTPIKRKQSAGWAGEDEGITYPKSRGRSASMKEDAAAAPSSPAKRLASDNSPPKKGAKKTTPGTRAASTPQRPKTRSGSNARPPTRGQLDPTIKRPEGDPPWLASMYKPDPRLPPDQQLLPTVAKRLQQEQWEKEGKFGNLYDTEFRPLNDEVHESPPSTQKSEQKKPEDAEWPLTSPKSPTLSAGRPGTAGGQGSYSTMPKITTGTGAPMGVGPLPSPLPPARVPEPIDEKKDEGCGCCSVM